MSHEVVAETSSSLTRNSELRNQLSSKTQGAGRWIVENAPWATANRISFGSTAGVALAAIDEIRSQDENGISLRKFIGRVVKFGAPTILDMVDGPVARAEAVKNPGKADQMKGQVIDAANDRLQESILAFVRMIAAHKRGDRAGVLLALGSFILNGAPSMARAWAEKNGYAVPEAAAGSRSIRAVSGILGASIPESGLVQKGGEIFNIATNTVTAVQRVRIVLDPRRASGEVSETTRKEAEQRLKVLGVIAGATTAATVFTYRRLNR